MLIPLKDYIYNYYLPSLKIKNIYTNRYEDVFKIFNLNGSGYLDILMSQGYMIETKYNFATDSKEFGLVKIEQKPKISYKTVEQEFTVKKYRYITVKTGKFKLVNTGKKKTVTVAESYYKKIGKTKYFVTEYKKKKIPIRKKIPITKKQRQYYDTVEIKKVEIPIETKRYTYKKIAYKRYIQFYLYEEYRYIPANSKLEHILCIKPFYTRYSNAIEISEVDSFGNEIFTTPEQFTQTKIYNQAITDCRNAMYAKVTQDEQQKFFKNYLHYFKKNRKARQKINKNSYSYTLDIIDLVFFTDSKEIDNGIGNKQVTRLSKAQFEKELTQEND